MRNFVKVLLVGTVLAGACVLLPKDSWAKDITVYGDSFKQMTINPDTGDAWDKQGNRYLLIKFKRILTGDSVLIFVDESGEEFALGAAPVLGWTMGKVSAVQGAAKKGQETRAEYKSFKEMDYGIWQERNDLGEKRFKLNGEIYSTYEEAKRAVSDVKPFSDSTTVIGTMQVKIDGREKTADVLQSGAIMLENELIGVFDSVLGNTTSKLPNLNFEGILIKYNDGFDQKSFDMLVGREVNGRILRKLPGDAGYGWEDSLGDMYKDPYTSSYVVTAKAVDGRYTNSYARMVDTTKNGTIELQTIGGKREFQIKDGVVLDGEGNPWGYVNAEGYFVQLNKAERPTKDFTITSPDSGNSQQPKTDTTGDATEPATGDTTEPKPEPETPKQSEESAGDTTEPKPEPETPKQPEESAGGQEESAELTPEERKEPSDRGENLESTLGENADTRPGVLETFDVSSSTLLTKENASVLTFDLLFGEGQGPKFVDDLSGQGGRGKWDVSDEQNAKLKRVYGITLDEDGYVTTDYQHLASPGSPLDGEEIVENKLGKGIVDLMSEMTLANNGEGYHSLLETHAGNSAALRDANAAVSAAEAKVAKMGQKQAKNGTDPKAEADYIAAVDQLREAREKQKAAQENYDKTEAGLKVIQDLANANYGHAMDQALDTAKSTFGEAGAAYYTAYEKAIKAEDYEAAQLVLNKALADEVITEDQRQDLMDKTTAVEGTDAVKKKIDAGVNGVDKLKEKTTEVDLQDVIRIASLTATPFVTETELALRENVNILAGDIGQSVAAVEDTALSDVDIDASMPSTVGGTATAVAELLKNAKVDLKLLDETFEEEKKTEIQIGGLASAGSQTGVSATLNTPQQEEKPEEEKKYLTDEQVNQIREKRQMLLKQYVNAAVQISEGMNAVSNKFADRANVLISFSEGVQNEASAFGLTQDVGRYVLLESLRAVALSSAQMGVQAARMLNEQEVDNEIK